MKKRMEKNSLRLRLKSYRMQSTIPFSLLILLLLLFLLFIGNTYNKIVLNITTANQNILTFKHDVDYPLYRTVIGSANSHSTDIDDDLTDPYQVIADMKNNMITLKKMTDNGENRHRLDNIISRLDSLKGMADTINARVQEKGHYDDNMNFLELNVYILTELITTQVNEYVYYEAAHLEIVRQKLLKTLFFMVLITLCMYGLILLLLKRVSRAIETSVLTPIKSICTSTEFIGKGEFVTIPMAHYDIEVGILAESINRMSLEIKRLLETTKNEQEQLKRTELQLYQSQINPHFLYNTLDTIVALVESSLESDAVMLIERLSDFFRTSLSGGRSKISIKDEINHVRSYLEIQKVRYQDIMEYHIDLDQAIENFQIIKLTLQPLVENALYHGIKQRRGVGHITITGRMKERNTLSFTVQDDGIGMEEKKVEALRHYINTPTIQNAQTFGLHNVNQRLILNYGKEYGLTIGRVEFISLKISSTFKLMKTLTEPCLRYSRTRLFILTF